MAKHQLYICGFIFVTDGNASAFCINQKEQSYESIQRLG